MTKEEESRTPKPKVLNSKELKELKEPKKLKEGMKVQVLKDLSLYDPATFTVTVRVKSGTEGQITKVIEKDIYLVAFDETKVPLSGQDLKEVK